MFIRMETRILSQAITQEPNVKDVKPNHQSEGPVNVQESQTR